MLHLVFLVHTCTMNRLGINVCTLHFYCCRSVDIIDLYLIYSLLIQPRAVIYIYHVTGNFGDSFNLVIWQLESQLPNQNYQILVQCTCAIRYEYKSPNNKFANSAFWLLHQNYTMPKFPIIR